MWTYPKRTRTVWLSMYAYLVSYKHVLQRKYFPALDIRVIKENYMLWVVHPLLYCIYFQFVKFRLVKMCYVFDAENERKIV